MMRRVLKIALHYCSCVHVRLLGTRCGQNARIPEKHDID